MIFEENKTIESLGEKVGYILSYFIFTTILFLILSLFKKNPESLSYLDVMGITILISLLGILINRILK